MEKKLLPFLLLLLLALVSCHSDGDDTYQDFVAAAPFSNYDNKGQQQLSKNSELLILIPDTQLYMVQPEHHRLLEGVIDRILEMKDSSYQIKAVLQVGDVTEKNSPMEWKAARGIFGKLDDEIDYILTTGNHDYGKDGTTNSRQTYFSEYFQYESSPSFQGSMLPGNFENTYFQFEIHDRPFQLLSLEFGPRDRVVEWADSIARQNKDRTGILLTHAYLSQNIERYDYSRFSVAQSLTPYAWANSYPDFSEGSVNDGQQLWDKLVFGNNIRFALSGHRTAVGNLISPNSQKQEVLQMIFAEHRMPEAVDGWIQILEFYKDGRTVGVKTYSALKNEWKTDAVHQFEFEY